MSTLKIRIPDIEVDLPDVQLCQEDRELLKGLRADIAALTTAIKSQSKTNHPDVAVGTEFKLIEGDEKIAKNVVQRSLEPLDSSQVTVTPTPPSEKNQRTKGGSCTIPNCSKKVYCKKMCDSHYQSYRQAVRNDHGAEWLLKHQVSSLPPSTRTGSHEIQASSDEESDSEEHQTLTAFEVEKAIAVESPNVVGNVCVINECGCKIHSRGLCATHYTEYREAVNSGEEANFLSKYGISALKEGKRGRKSNAELAKNKTLGQDQYVLSEYKRISSQNKTEKLIKLTSTNASTVFQYLDSKLSKYLDSDTVKLWKWEYQKNSGYVVTDMSEGVVKFLSPRNPCWESLLYEKSIIMDFCNKFDLKAIYIDGEKVPVLKYKSYYLLPEKPDKKFLLRATNGMDSDSASYQWAPGDTFYVSDLKMMGNKLTQVVFWLIEPPEVHEGEEWKNALENLAIIKDQELMSKFFELIYVGDLPPGAYPGLKSDSTAQPMVRSFTEPEQTSYVE